MNKTLKHGYVVIELVMYSVNNVTYFDNKEEAIDSAASKANENGAKHALDDGIWGRVDDNADYRVIVMEAYHG